MHVIFLISADISVTLLSLPDSARTKEYSTQISDADHL